jgi:hypothetical protein
MDPGFLYGLLHEIRYQEGKEETKYTPPDSHLTHMYIITSFYPPICETFDNAVRTQRMSIYI